MSGAPTEPQIVVGDNVFIGNGCTLSAVKRIEIGSNVLVSTQVRIHDNDGHPVNSTRRKAGESAPYEDAQPVVIEENAWVGAQAIILKGVRIGKDSVIGAGSIVTKDVPAGAIVAGNPAKVVSSTRDES